MCKKFMFAAMFAALTAPVCAMDLSLGDAVARIVEQSQDIKKADANVKRAQAQLDATNANRWFNIQGTVSYMNLINVEDPRRPMGLDLPPELGGLLANITGMSMSSIEMPDNILSAGVSITQPIYTFGKIGNAVTAVKAAIKMSESGREATLREVKYSAANLYWTAKMTDEIVEIAKKSLADARDAKRNLAVAGRANRSSLVKIEADIAAKEIDLSNAEFNRDTAHRMLKILAGLDVDADITLTDGFPDAFPEMQARELKSNPQWDILSQQVKMYEDQAKSRRASNYPTLAATASYSYVAMHTDLNVLDGNKNQSAYWGLALQVPIFSGGLNGANATADAMNAEAARQDLDKSKKLLTEEYNTAVARYNHLRGNLAGLKNARDLAAQAYRISVDRFAAGQTSAAELAEVSGALYQMDTALISAKYNILMSAESVKKLGE